MKIFIKNISKSLKILIFTCLSTVALSQVEIEKTYNFSVQTNYASVNSAAVDTVNTLALGQFSSFFGARNYFRTLYFNSDFWVKDNLNFGAYFFSDIAQDFSRFSSLSTALTYEMVQTTDLQILASIRPTLWNMYIEPNTVFAGISDWNFTVDAGASIKYKGFRGAFGGNNLIPVVFIPLFQEIEVPDEYHLLLEYEIDFPIWKLKPYLFSIKQSTYRHYVGFHVSPSRYLSSYIQYNLNNGLDLGTDFGVPSQRKERILIGLAVAFFKEISINPDYQIRVQVRL